MSCCETSNAEVADLERVQLHEIQERVEHDHHDGRPLKESTVATASMSTDHHGHVGEAAGQRI